MTRLIRWFARDLDVPERELAAATRRALAAAPIVLAAAWFWFLLLWALSE